MKGFSDDRSRLLNVNFGNMAALCNGSCCESYREQMSVTMTVQQCHPEDSLELYSN